MMNKTFLVLYKPGKGWLSGEPISKQPLQAHLNYMLELHDKGQLLMGGPFSDGTGGAVILLVGSLAEAEALIDKDPAIVQGVFAPKIYEWEMATGTSIRS